jgi:hypothetical protein
VIEPVNIDLGEFLATWYGPAAKDPTPLPDSCAWLPRPLREWHVLAARWDVPLESVTTMIPPERIEAADGRAVFMVDATGDWRWCFDPEDPDGVYDAELHEPWERNPERLEEFLVHRAVSEVLHGAPATLRAFDVPDEALRDVLGPLEEAAFGAWRWPTPGYRTFMGDQVVVQIVRSGGEPRWYVQAAAPEPGRLSGLGDIAGVDWRR